MPVKRVVQSGRRTQELSWNEPSMLPRRMDECGPSTQRARNSHGNEGARPPPEAGWGESPRWRVSKEDTYTIHLNAVKQEKSMPQLRGAHIGIKP